MPINIPAFAYREMLAHTSGILELRILLHLCNFPSVELLTYIFVCLAELLCAHVPGKNEVDKFIRGYLMRKHKSWPFGLLNLPIFTELFRIANFSVIYQILVMSVSVLLLSMLFVLGYQIRALNLFKLKHEEVLIFTWCRYKFIPSEHIACKYPFMAD